MQKINRNDACSCGSGKKFKKCCEAKASIKNIEVQTAISLIEEKTSSLFRKNTNVQEKNQKML